MCIWRQTFVLNCAEEGWRFLSTSLICHSIGTNCVNTIWFIFSEKLLVESEALTC